MSAQVAPSIKEPSIGIGPPSAAFPRTQKRDGTVVDNLEKVYVYCSNKEFRRWWLGIVLLHVMCMAFYAFWGVLYVVLYDSGIAITLRVFGFDLKEGSFPGIGALYGIFAVLHLGCLGSIAYSSLLSRRLVLHSHSSVLNLQVTRTGFASLQDKQSLITRRPVANAIKTLWHHIYDWDGLLGVAGEHFDLVFLLQEVCEIFLQVVQAYRLSRWTSRIWVVRMYVLLIVCNCCSTAVIQKLHKLHLARQRNLCRVWDMLIDFASAVCLPVVLTLPYFALYSPDEKSFSYDVWYDERLFVKTLNEFQLIAITSWMDIANLILFSVFMLICLRTTARIVREKHEVSRLTGSELVVLSHEPNSKKSSLITFIHKFLILTGITILVVHIHTELQPSSSHCELKVRPWLTTATYCSVVTFHCERLRIAGREVELKSYVQGINPETVLFTQFRHCPELEIPSELEDFRNLVGMRLYNTTLYRWDEAAALTADSHPAMTFVYIVHTFLDGIPVGLRTSPFPPKIMDMELCATNLTTLPVEVQDVWKNLLVLVLDNNSFSSVPDVLVKMQVPYLSMVNNYLKELPCEILEGAATSRWFNGNPIQFLPADVDISVSLGALRVEMSNISSLPNWAATFFTDYDGWIIAGGSPICADIGNALFDSTPGNHTLLPRYSAFVNRNLICIVDEGDDFTYFPFELEAALDSRE